MSYPDNNLPTVSGGKDGNPPDRYELVQLTGAPATDLAAINNLAEQGYRFAGVLPEFVTGTATAFNNYVLMGNYKENK